MAAPTHPGLTPAEFAAPMERAGWWKAPMELIDVEVVVIPPTGGGASLAQTEIVRRIGGWQTDRGAGGRLLTDVFARVGDAIVAPDVAWWSAGREPAIGWGAIEVVHELSSSLLPGPATAGSELLA